MQSMSHTAGKSHMNNRIYMVTNFAGTNSQETGQNPGFRKFRSFNFHAWFLSHEKCKNYICTVTGNCDRQASQEEIGSILSVTHYGIAW